MENLNIKNLIVGSLLFFTGVIVGFFTYAKISSNNPNPNINKTVVNPTPVSNLKTPPKSGAEVATPSALPVSGGGGGGGGSPSPSLKK